MAWKGNLNNPAPNLINENDNLADKRTDINRSGQIRRDVDKLKNFTVTLLDIDNAIFDYLDKIINPTLLDAGDNIKVPILFGNPERWKAVQTDGAIRDNTGKLQLPAIMFKRNTVAKNQNLATLNRHLNVPVLRKFDEKNKYDKFSMMTQGTAPVAQVLNVTLPDHMTLTYEFMLWTEYVEQMNSLIEKINFAAEEYWGDPKRFKFRVYITDYSNNVEVQSGKDRMVRTTFSMTVQAYLLTDSFENKKLTTTKTFTPRKVIISNEMVTEESISAADKIIKENSYKKTNPYSYLSSTIVADNEIDGLPIPKFTAVEGGDTSLVSNVIPRNINIINAYTNLATQTSACAIWHNPPNTPYDYGEEGWMAYDDSFHYIYVNGQWLRQPLANFQNF